MFDETYAEIRCKRLSIVGQAFMDKNAILRIFPLIFFSFFSFSCFNYGLALISKRVYKDAFSFEVTRAIIIGGRGKHFDPQVVDAFLENEDEFRRIGGLINDRTPNIA